jgi:hypothetical protein
MNLQFRRIKQCSKSNVIHTVSAVLGPSATACQMLGSQTQSAYFGFFSGITMRQRR